MYYFCAQINETIEQNQSIFTLSLIKKKHYDFKEKHPGFTSKESHC